MGYVSFTLNLFDKRCELTGEVDICGRYQSEVTELYRFYDFILGCRDRFQRGHLEQVSDLSSASARSS